MKTEIWRERRRQRGGGREAAKGRGTGKTARGVATEVWRERGRALLSVPERQVPERQASGAWVQANIFRY